MARRHRRSLYAPVNVSWYARANARARLIPGHPWVLLQLHAVPSVIVGKYFRKLLDYPRTRLPRLCSDDAEKLGEAGCAFDRRRFHPAQNQSASRCVDRREAVCGTKSPHLLLPLISVTDRESSSRGGDRSRMENHDGTMTGQGRHERNARPGMYALLPGLRLLLGFIQSSI